MPTRSSVVPCLRYRDAPRAIEWLCQVFGFAPHMVIPGENGAIAHAQLSHGGGMIMLGSLSNEGEYGKLIVQPDQISGAQTQTVYLVVDDADAVYARVKAAGVPVLIDIVDEDYGGRGFTCRDLEDHVWSIGTYDPWAQEGSMDEDEKAIRELIATWINATREGDIDTVMSLCTEDVVFSMPGRAPMEGREAFRAQMQAMNQGFQLAANSVVEEVGVAGDMAFSRTHLDITMTPKDGKPAVRRSGNTLSVLRREADGKWRLARDANMLGPVNKT